MRNLVVVGMGYVGLPLAIEATKAGMRVHGLDVDVTRVDGLLAGNSHIDDVSDGDLREALQQGFTPTHNPECVKDADVVTICVPTPLHDSRPDLTAVLAAAATVATHLQPGSLVVLESTTYPGTTDEVLKPMLEKAGYIVGTDIYLAFSPERIDPGNQRFHLTNTPKVIGGSTPACTARAAQFYQQLVSNVVTVSSPAVAEMTKLLENTYRQVNIALVNEMAVFCHELGVDLWETIAAASTKPFGFQAFYPGPGVGGHCIPIDPGYLSHRVRSLGYPFRFVELAQEINARMPAYVVERLTRLLNERCQTMRGAQVLLLGVTYKADIADQRESPARMVARRLLQLGVNVQYHDPFVAEWIVDDHRLSCSDPLDTAVRLADVVVVLRAHSCYDIPALAASAPLLFDTSGQARGVNAVRL